MSHADSDLVLALGTVAVLLRGRGFDNGATLVEIAGKRIDELHQARREYRDEALRHSQEAALRRAINKAAGELPDGVEISIVVERGAASVYLHDGVFEKSLDVDADDRLTAEVLAAIEAATTRAEAAP